MKLKIITIIFLLLAINNLLGNSPEKINIFTENSYPQNMVINGKLSGTSVEILDSMFKQMKSKQSLKSVRVTNWARGYAITQKKKNTMIFSTARTKEREKLFKWVGPIKEINIGIISLKTKKIKINKISDLNHYRVGVILKDVGEMFLLDNGVKKDVMEYVSSDNAIEMYFKKMKTHKIEVFSYEVDMAFEYGKANGFDMSKYEVIYVLKKIDLYFAFNKNTDDSIINKWQKALDEIKSNGLFAKIMQK